MKMKIRRQYGLWESPITPLSLARGLRFSDVAWDDEILVWHEWRSDRGVLMVQPADDQAPRELNSELSVRAKVGYGGGDFAVGHGYAYFIEDKSGRIYRQPLAAGTARAITPGFGFAAAPAPSPDGKWLLFVHTYERRDSIAIVDSAGHYWPQRPVSGEDFYMQPRWHPDGTRIAWIAWNHPNMPWDGTFLQLGVLKQSGAGLPYLTDVETVAGGKRTAIFQPEFSPDGRFLAYVSDATGWWELYLYDLESKEHRQLTDEPYEHGLPAWVQGLRTYAFSPDGRYIFYLRNEAGFSSLWRYDLRQNTREKLALDEEYTDLAQPAVSAAGRLALLASGGRIPPRVLVYDPESQSVQVRRRATAEELPAAAYAQPEAITWRGLDGGTVHGLFYRPHNERFEGLGKPPLLVLVHGGPTSQSRAFFNQTAQFFATRGYAVLDVNYRGSTGYGREYRDALKTNWGIYDVQDSVSGARHLADQGLVDSERMAIMGGSAGGFTVLKALEDYPGFFKAGVCLYGVSNHFTLAAETHKFEERYLDQLLGPLPEAAEIYRERSPIFFADKIKDPIIIFQGEDDRVVPRNQSDTIVESLRRRGVPHEYHVYPGEGHGFRKSETIKDFYEKVERFLRQHLIFA